MKNKILIYFGTLMVLISLATSFNLDVICPTYAFLPGDEVSCNLRLDEEIPRSIFGLQFIIQADGLEAADGFFQPLEPLVGSSGGLDDQTLLFTLMPFAIEAWNIAEVNLEIPTDTPDGDYQVSLVPSSVDDVLTSVDDALTPFDTNPATIRVRGLGGPVGEQGMLGDVDGDNQITLDDAIMVAQHVQKIEIITNQAALRSAEVACPGNSITLDDAITIAQVSQKILPEASLGCTS